MAGMAKVDVQLNRTTSNTVLSRSLPVNEELHYQLYNSAGKLVFSKSIIMINAGERLIEKLDVSHLPSGRYTLTVTSGNEILEKIQITL